MKKVLDKPEETCYTIITKGKEIKKKMYFKSTLTGQCYAADFIPQFGGYELITKAEYEAWLKKMGL